MISLNVTVVVVEVNRTKVPVAVLANTDFPAWKAWFKANAMLITDQVMAEGTSYLFVRGSDGHILEYTCTQVALNPHAQTNRLPTTSARGDSGCATTSQKRHTA